MAAICDMALGRLADRRLWCVFCQANSKVPKVERFSHTLLVTITLVCRFVSGLIHYEVDATVGKSSIVGVGA